MATLGPLPPVPGVLHIVLAGTSATRKWANGLHWGYTGTPPTNATCQALGNLLANAWQANIASLQPSPIVMTTITVTDLSSPTSGQGVVNPNIAGTRGDDVIGANTAVLISYPVQGRFRGGHPRTYLLAGGNADNQDGMNWHPAFAAGVDTQWRAFLAAIQAMATGGMAMGQFGFVRYNGRFLPNDGPPGYRLTTPVFVPLQTAAAFTQTQMASQRRRIGRVGR